jgi:hypothetical protein
MLGESFALKVDSNDDIDDFLTLVSIFWSRAIALARNSDTLPSS